MSSTPPRADRPHPRRLTHVADNPRTSADDPVVADEPADLGLLFDLRSIETLVHEASDATAALMLVIGHGIQLYLPSGSAVWADGWAPPQTLEDSAAQLQRRRDSHLGDDQQHELPLLVGEHGGLHAVVTNGVACGDTALSVTVSAETITVTTSRRPPDIEPATPQHS
ncbi:hypothetical protein [Catellatospora methionotrophica]|uniref:hypothetical protein n=1 Tax=Catellatospora methionotrophica TaxID=121620 RepID=UPI0033E55083